MLQRLADRFILQPTCHHIAAPEKRRRLIQLGDRNVEAWTHGSSNGRSDDTELFVLKLPGAGGRAERASDHPAEVWSQWRVQIWSLNPPGYGGSSGRASIRSIPAAIDAAYEALREEAGGRPIVVMGNSLGTAGALYLAARAPIAGMILRNPLPLQQLILGRFGWWNLGWGAGLIARQVPAELNSLLNAKQSTAPCVFISARRDRVVPVAYQQQVIDAYAGEHRVVHLPQADHATPMSDEEAVTYCQQLQWLGTEVSGQTSEVSRRKSN